MLDDNKYMHQDLLFMLVDVVELVKRRVEKAIKNFT
jgi:hypothetical protein